MGEHFLTFKDKNNNNVKNMEFETMDEAYSQLQRLRGVWEGQIVYQQAPSVKMLDITFGENRVSEKNPPSPEKLKQLEALLTGPRGGKYIMSKSGTKTYKKN